MNLQIMKVGIRHEQDIVLARQRARAVASLLGFDLNDQTRISTAMSEIVRNAFQYGGGCEMELLVEGGGRPQTLVARVSDRGPGIADLPAILEGRYRSKTGMGLGIVGARRLMDHFHIESSPGAGTDVTLGKTIPADAPLVTQASLAQLSDALLRQQPGSPFEEIQQQNQELLRAMGELRKRQEELAGLNRELEDTNRGIVALYKELDEKASHLNTANELKARFLSNMSHEFRTPLNSILSLSRLLIDRVDGELTEEQEKQVHFIRSSAEGLSSLVDDLLDLARIEAGKTVVHPRPFEVASLFSALRGMLKPILFNPAVDLVFEEPTGVPLMLTDEGKVSQILRNFISNAIKFTEKGEIRVTCRLSEDGTSVVFSVTDTGIGIPAEHLGRIFDEYSQIDTPLQRKVKGTGLGLALSAKLAALLGGTVTVQSTPGQGSTFSATIPVEYDGQPAVARGEQGAPDASKLSILVVEDDEAACLLYEKFLKGSGFQVRCAGTVSEAREALARFRPIAIVLDIILPGEDGWRFLAELKSNDATRDIPVFIASVLEDNERGFSLGADDVVTKPVERKWLVEKLREAAARAPVEKVLLIDDEEVSRYILKGLLADTKYTVLEASGGMEGLRLAELEQPSVIFLDLMMPEMDGFETLSRLKSSPKTGQIPVIILTSQVLDEEEHKRLNARTLAVLSKGSTSREVAISKIRDAIARIATAG